MKEARSGTGGHAFRRCAGTVAITCTRNVGALRRTSVRGRDFETFYVSSKDRCYRALLATVNDVTEADDLLSEAFTRAWREWKTVSAHPAPEAWVVRTALNVHRDRFRKSNNSKRMLAVAPGAYEDVPESLDPELLAALRLLPDQQRLVVALRVLLDLDTRQTAAEMGIAPGTVTTHLKRALGALRTHLATDYTEAKP